MFLLLLLLLLCPYSISSGYINSISLTVQSPQSELVAGASIQISYSATALDASNSSTARLVPFWDNLQFGAEVGFGSFSSGQLFGEAFMHLQEVI